MEKEARRPDSEQSASSSGLDGAELQRNPFLTILTTEEMVRYK